MSAPCKHCGKAREDHHDFEMWSVPEGCQCDAGTWLPDTPGYICHGYQGNGTEYCMCCCHDMACHEKEEKP